MIKNIKNIALALLVAASLLLTTLNQWTGNVYAQTRPVTAPITPPISIAIFKLGGKISLNVYDRWMQIINHIPLAKIRVIITNMNTNQTTQVITGLDGKYQLFLPQGVYTVQPKDIKYKFTPQLSRVILIKDTTELNFQVIQKIY